MLIQPFFNHYSVIIQPLFGHYSTLASLWFIRIPQSRIVKPVPPPPAPAPCGKNGSPPEPRLHLGSWLNSGWLENGEKSMAEKAWVKVEKCLISGQWLQYIKQRWLISVLLPGQWSTTEWYGESHCFVDGESLVITETDQHSSTTPYHFMGLFLTVVWWLPLTEINQYWMLLSHQLTMTKNCWATLSSVFRKLTIMSNQY